MNTKLFLTVSGLALGLATLGPSARAADPMTGMDMGGTKAAASPASMSVTATVNPNPPQAGSNKLDLHITGADGKPITGLKLTAGVAMTSMDMGTTHPAFTDAGNGHYSATVTFGMAGPWRVVVRGQSGKLAVLNFDAGGKTPWKSPPAKAAPVPQAAQDTSMPGMNMGSTKMGDMKTSSMDMKTASVPQLQEEGTYQATGSEDWKAQTGFGHNAGMVGMMNQMMVGGSGMEGMKMPAMKMDFGPQNYTKPEGDDTSAGDMPGMNMGTKSGDKTDAMAGMKMDTAAPASPASASPMPPPSPAAAAAPAPVSEAASAAPPKVTTTINAPKAGDNALTITVTDAQGKPVTGAKITTSVAMTSMDMGTSHPTVKELGGGKYAATATFSMAGPWRVKLKVAAPGLPAQSKAFDFAAK